MSRQFRSAILTLALLFAGTALIPAVQAQDKPAPKEKAPNPFGGMLDLDQLLELFGPLGMPPEQMDMLRKQMKELQKQLEGLQRGGGAFPGGFPGGFPRLPNMRGFPKGLFPNIPGLKPRRGGLDTQPRAPLQPVEGLKVKKPTEEMINQPDLPKGKGMVIEEVDGDSPASKLGLKLHDILLEIDGKPVPNDMKEFHDMLAKLDPEKKVDVIVLRKGRNETIKDVQIPAKKKPKRLQID